MLPSKTLLDIVSQPFKRSQLGLFHGKMKQYGNNVPFSKHKTRRTWLPNVQQKRLPSEILNKDVRVKVTTRAMRSIKKHGGLDKYVENTRFELLGWQGMRIRLMLREVQKKQRGEFSVIKGKEREKFLQTPEGQEWEKQEAMVEELKAHQRHQNRVKNNVLPTWEMAKVMREQATAALGLTNLATGNKTIRYMQNRIRN